MADESKIRPTTAFTRGFAAALRHVMAARGVSQQSVADEIGRNQGFVSERTSGKRPCDTDIIAGIATVARVEPRQIVKETLARMQQAPAADELDERRQRRQRREVAPDLQTRASRPKKGKPTMGDE